MADNVAKKIEKFFDVYRLQQFDAGEVLVQAGSPPPGVFYLVEGSVRQYDITSGGDEVVVNVFKTPAFFPMSWAINDTSNDYFFETAEPVKLKIAPRQAVVEFLQANPDVTFDLLARVFRGADGLLKRTTHLMGGSAHSRVLLELILESRRFGQPDGTSYLLKMTGAELAARAGLTRETVSRELNLLKKARLISSDSKGIKVKNIGKLQSALGDSL